MLPPYLYHATSKEYAQNIAKNGLEPISGEEKGDPYLCMSAAESGAVTKYSQATDIIFRVEGSKLNESDWKEKGAGKSELRSLKGIPGNLLEYRRNLGTAEQKKWRSASKFTQ